MMLEEEIKLHRFATHAARHKGRGPAYPAKFRLSRGPQTPKPNRLLWITSKMPSQSSAAPKTREVPHGLDLLDAAFRKMPSMWFWVSPPRVA
ncbi:hypothetical protein ABIG04_009999 [Bradyrhizobium japonicum]